MPHATRARDHHIARHVDEQPVLHYSRARIQLYVQRRRVRDRPEVAVQDDIALVGLEGLAATPSAAPAHRPARASTQPATPS